MHLRTNARIVINAQKKPMIAGIKSLWAKLQYYCQIMTIIRDIISQRPRKIKVFRGIRGFFYIFVIQCADNTNALFKAV